MEDLAAKYPESLPAFQRMFPTNRTSMEQTTRTEALFFISKLSTRLAAIEAGTLWAHEDAIEDLVTEIAKWTSVANAAANN